MKYFIRLKEKNVTEINCVILRRLGKTWELNSSLFIFCEKEITSQTIQWVNAIDARIRCPALVFQQTHDPLNTIECILYVNQYVSIAPLVIALATITSKICFRRSVISDFTIEFFTSLCILMRYVYILIQINAESLIWSNWDSAL